MSDSRPFCRGCGGDDVEIMCEYAYEDVWAAIETHVQLTVPPGLRASLSPAPAVGLYRCKSCLTDSFHPARAGGGDFYAWLSMSNLYYEAVRWEFSVVAEQLDRGQRVVDVGCGPGGFIRMAIDRGADAVGVDENPRARAAVEALGARTHSSTVDAARGAPYDVATAFQVIEHVERADRLLTEIANLVGLGGHIFVSVPNRERLDDGEMSGLDYPPHHLTRWSPKSLVEAGQRAGLEAKGIRRERPHPSLLRGEIDDLLSDIPGLAPLAGLLARLAVNRYTIPSIAKFGFDRSLEGHGHTVLVNYRRVA